MGEEERSGFEKWLRNISEEVGLQALLDKLQAAKVEDVPVETVQYIQDHPGQVALLIIGGLAFVAPAILYGPALKLLGFGSKGVGAGSLAAQVQAGMGRTVHAGGTFAHLTSAGAGGYGVAAVSASTRAAAAIVVGGTAIDLAGRAHQNHSVHSE